MTETEADIAGEERQAPTLSSILTSEGFAKQDRLFESAADRALMERPTFNIRTRVQLALLLLFLFSLCTTLWAINTMGRVQQKVRFVEMAEDFTAEVLEARRYEKTFLLYGTNLDDARHHVESARRLATQQEQEFRHAVGREAVGSMERHLTAYYELLTSLEERERSQHDEELRRHGGALVELAQSLLMQERLEIAAILSRSRLVFFAFLVILLVILVVVFSFLYRPINSSMLRLEGYTERIAAGDFTPITPAREYRDEFSHVALMINRMLRALDRQHRILVESHKLRAMGTLVAGVAHELNNPMNNMLLTASLLEEEYDALEDSERQEMLRDLTTQAERTKSIVRNLLDFARESDTKVEPIDLRQLLEQTVKLVANQARMKKVRLIMELPETLPVVHGDQQLLSQVFMNLIINAIEVLAEGGKIRIRHDTDRREGFLGIDIADNGPGMPNHVMEQIFDPFFTTKPKGKGTGLGLSVSRGIVRKLGGYLLVESTLGEGSVFTVLLPITPVPSDISSGAATATTFTAASIASEGT